MVTPEAAKALVQGLVIGKLDYCNTLLLGVSDQQASEDAKHGMPCY